MMAVTPIVIHDRISVHKLTDMSDTRNILFDGSNFFTRWRYVIQNRLQNAPQKSLRIHVRFYDNSYATELQYFSQLAQLGAEVYVWTLPGEYMTVYSNLNVVICANGGDIAQENFLIVDSESMAKGLIAWESETDIETHMRGLLITHPESVSKLRSQLDMITHRNSQK
jgi:hypothetical protein